MTHNLAITMHKGQTQLISPDTYSSPHTHISQDTHNPRDMQNTLMDTQSGQRSLLDIQDRNSSWDMQETFSDADNMQVETHSGYSLSRIRSFLRTTKGMRFLQLEDYFPNLQLFQKSAKHYEVWELQPVLFTDQELYLKKLLLNMRSHLDSTRPHTSVHVHGVDMQPLHGGHQVGHSTLTVLRRKQKEPQFFRSSTAKKLSVSFLQETHSTLDNEPDWRRDRAGQLFLSHRSSKSEGLGVLFSRDFVCLSASVEEPVPGRLLKISTVFVLCAQQINL